MEIVDVEKYLEALSILFENLSFLKYGLEEKKEDIEDDLLEITEKIKEDIENQSHLKYEDLEDYDEIVNYENELSKYLSIFIKKDITNRNLDDEIDLIKNSYNVSVNKINDYKLYVQQTIDKLIKKMDLTVPNIISLARNLEYLVYIPHEEIGAFIGTTKTQYRNKNKIALFHLMNDTQKKE